MDLSSPRAARRIAGVSLGLGVLALAGFLGFTASARRAEATRAETRFADAHPGAAGTLVTIDVAGMTCAGCARSVDEGLRKVPGVTACEVDLARGVAEVRLASADVAPTALLAAVADAGYSGKVEAAAR